MIVNLLSWSLVEGTNRADFGANPFTNATSATITRNRVVEAYIVGDWTEILNGIEQQKNERMCGTERQMTVTLISSSS